jgi:hypothetical protein
MVAGEHCFFYMGDWIEVDKKQMDAPQNKAIKQSRRPITGKIQDT